MDDGTFAKGVLKLCTDQVLFLSDMLLSKFDIAYNTGKYRLYIARVEMDKVLFDSCNDVQGWTITQIYI